MPPNASFISEYKTRLITIKLLPLMYILKLSDILFFIKAVQCSTTSFNILQLASIFSNSARPQIILHDLHHHYFVRICHLWNALAPNHYRFQPSETDLFLGHFTYFFDSLDHLQTSLCPCTQSVHHQFFCQLLTTLILTTTYQMIFQFYLFSF